MRLSLKRRGIWTGGVGQSGVSVQRLGKVGRVGEHPEEAALWAVRLAEVRPSGGGATRWGSISLHTLPTAALSLSLDFQGSPYVLTHLKPFFHLGKSGFSVGFCFLMPEKL